MGLKFDMAPNLGVAPRIGVAPNLGVAPKISMAPNLGVAPKIGMAQNLGVAPKIGVDLKFYVGQNLHAQTLIIVEFCKYSGTPENVFPNNKHIKILVKSSSIVSSNNL